MICLDPQTKNFYSLGYRSPPWKPEDKYKKWSAEDYVFFADKITKEEASKLCLNGKDFIRICSLNEAVEWHKS